MKIINTGVADVRTEPKFESERDSQLIYGESVNLLEDLGEYSKIKSIDNLTGYVKSYLLSGYTERKYKVLKFYNGENLKFPFGSLLSSDDIKRYKVPESYYNPIENNNYSVIDLSKKFLGVPYLWGGTSDFGFDCSGYVQRLYRFINIELPRNSSRQRDFSKNIDSFSNALPGDLIFFKNHVALYLGDGNIIHANGHASRVSMNNLFDKSDYSKKLNAIFEKIGRII